MNFTNMDITAKIKQLEAERVDQTAIKSKAHARIIEINRQIGKLETILKNAEEVLSGSEETPSNGLEVNHGIQDEATTV